MMKELLLKLPKYPCWLRGLIYVPGGVGDGLKLQ